MTPAILSLQAAMLCHVAFVYLVRGGGRGGRREKAVCWAAILLQAMGLQGLVGDAGSGEAGFHIGMAVGYFSLLALAVLAVVDHPVHFPRSWRALSLCAAVGCTLALLPIRGHAIEPGGGLIVHFVLATLAYGFYLASLSQLAELLYLSRSLGSPSSAEVSLPLLEMEERVFRNIQIGFAVLTLTIASGMAVSLMAGEGAGGLSHKTLFAWLTWLASSVLLLCRWRLGWRGRTALNWMAAAGICLFLSYLGTSIVLDLILERSG